MAGRFPEVTLPWSIKGKVSFGKGTPLVNEKNRNAPVFQDRASLFERWGKKEDDP